MLPIALVLATLLPTVFDQAGGGALPPPLLALEQRREALQTSVRQVRAKNGGDPKQLAALEPQFDALVGMVAKWQDAAFADNQASRAKAGDLSREVARAMATFARDARAYISGAQSPVLGTSITMFDNQMKAGVRAAERLDATERGAINQRLAWRPWAGVE